MNSKALSDRMYWVLLSGTPGVGPKTFFSLLEKFESAGTAWRASVADLLDVGLSPKTAHMIERRRQNLTPESYDAYLEKMGVIAVISDDEQYPALLRKISPYPPVLYVRGSVDVLSALSLAVVGTRKPTDYGREVTQALVRELVSLGFVIVSGLARGIDGIAHRTTLTQGGRTVAFLGGGIDMIYPSEHVGLAEQIIKSGGALVSEFPPGMSATRGSFPARNRLISGISLGVLVVEGLSQSGTVHTAHHAQKQGRSVFAVPGHITSRMSDAPMDLLTQGAVMVRSGKDIINHLQNDGYLAKDALQENSQRVSQASSPTPVFADDIEELVYLILEVEPMESDDIIKRSTLPASQVLTTLTLMELKGLVMRNGTHYSVAT